MEAHQLILLSPYNYPSRDAMTLADEDMACWLNGRAALWHPALLWQASGPPRCFPPYDYEDPQPGQIFAVPESPPLFLPDDWDERVRKVGAIAFRCTPKRETTFENLRNELRQRGLETPGFGKLIDLPDDQLAPFLGLGLGHQLLDALSEAMEHENLLEKEAFWDDVQHAAAILAGVPYTSTYQAQPNPEFADPYGEDFRGTGSSIMTGEPTPQPEGEFQEHENATAENGEPGASATGETGGEPGAPPVADAPGSPDVPPQPQDAVEESPPPAETDVDWQAHLRKAAERLLSAREVLYPVTIHILDLFLLHDLQQEDPWPKSFDQGVPLNVIASGFALERLAINYPDKLATLRERIQTGDAEVCGGCYLEREDALLSVDSQLWNMLRGQQVCRELLGADVHVFARRRFGFHPQMPLLLSTTGMTRTLLLTFDESGVPQYQTCVVSWPSPDGKQVDAFVRQPHNADTQTFFNLGNYLFKTTREDHHATLAFVHKGGEVNPWYGDMLELAKLAPVMGRWTTFSRYFDEVMAGEYSAALAADEFHSDYLSERTNRQLDQPVSGFALHLRLRRRVDACWTLAAMHRGLAGRNDTLDVSAKLTALEKQFEELGPSFAVPVEELEPLLAELAEVEKHVANTLAGRLQGRAAENQPGWMLLNPCAFARRVALELEGGDRPLVVADPVKACQLDGKMLRVVVEVPSLGFAWIPREGAPGTPAPQSRLKLAEKNIVRNEFLEAEIDPDTGGLRGIRDRKNYANRLGQRLVFNPGAVMKADKITITSSGSALGEIVTEGALLGDQQQVLAKFRQRFRAWLGRPILELRIEIEPVQPPAGYPWHAYFGSCFAWRDERTLMMRGVNGSSYITTHTRPQTPDYIELRSGRQRVSIFTGGLPFHQRHENRMVDVILIPEGEKGRVFDLAIGLDRDQPMQTSLGVVSPIAVVATSKGPPHVGSAGWLYHLDTPNLLMSRMIPGGIEIPRGGDTPPPDFADAITARLLECAGQSGHAEFRCVRDPQRAVLTDARGNVLVDATPSGDAVFLEVSPADLVHLQMQFSTEPPADKS